MNDNPYQPLQEPSFRPSSGIRKLWPRYAILACAGASVFSFAVDAVFNEDEFFLAGFLFAAAAVVLTLVFAFRGRFSALQRLGTGALILIALAVVGLMIFAAAMAGFSGIR